MLPTLSIRQVPLLRIAILMIIGMSIARYLCIGSKFEPLIIGLGIIIVLFSQQLISSPYLRSLLLNLNAILIGILLISVDTSSKYLETSDSTALNGKVSKLLEVHEFSVGEKYHTLYGQLLGYTNSSSDTRQPNVLLKVRTDATDLNISRGDLIISSVQLKAITSIPLANGFDYGQYLIDQGYLYQGFINHDQLKKSNHAIYPWWKMIRYNIRTKCISIIDKYVEGEANRITKALVLGDRSGLDKEIRSKYADSGIIHILAVSGLHVGIIALLLFQIIGSVLWWLKPYAWVKIIVIILGLIAFAELSGGAPTVWRAVIMTSTYLVSKALNRNSHPMNLLGLAALIILVIKPTDLFSVSFQLSFSAVSGILFFSPWLFKMFEPKHKFFKAIWAIVVVGICAQIGTLPFTLFYFHQLPTLSPIAGVIAIPAAYGIMGMGLLIILMESILPVINETLSTILEILIKMLNGTAATINTIPYSLITDIWITPIESALIASVIISVALWLYIQRRFLFSISLGLISLTLASHLIIKEANFNKIHKIIYRDAPMAMDIITQGTCYHYSENPTAPISDYLTSDIRSKYKVEVIIELNTQSLSDLKKGAK